MPTTKRTPTWAEMGHEGAGPVHVPTSASAEPASASRLRPAPAYAGTGDLLAVQQLLGHSNVSTTQRYVAIPRDGLRRAVAAVEIPLAV